MLKNIPIKIKTASKISHEDVKKALNLNEAALGQKIAKPKKKIRLWLFTVLALIILIIILAGRLFWLSQKGFSQYQKFILPEAKAIIFLKTNQLTDLTAEVVPGLEQNSSFFRWLKMRVQQFLSDSAVSAQNEFLPLFDEQIVFLILNSDPDSKISWAILGEIKNGQEQNKQAVFDKIQQGLKRDFGTDISSYRQTKINSVYSFNQTENIYYYSQVNNFVIITNDLASSQLLIDRLIDK